jgi:tetratricopeptide (TPR) repeat protein
MPTVQPPSHDVALETRFFWERFKNEIAAALIVALLAIAGFGAYRFYSDRRDAAASALLGTAKSAPDYQAVIARYPNTPAGADAYLLLADAQRKEKKFLEANATLQIFINKNPEHELVTTARMAMAANLEAMGKTDEASSMYQQIAASYPKDFNAPFALISRVRLLKAKNQIEEARRVCETVLTQYRDSIWASEAARELRLLKSNAPPKPATTPTVPPSLAAPSPAGDAPNPPSAPTPRN